MRRLLPLSPRGLEDLHAQCRTSCDALACILWRNLLIRGSMDFPVHLDFHSLPDEKSAAVPILRQFTSESARKTSSSLGEHPRLAGAAQCPFFQVNPFHGV